MAEIDIYTVVDTLVSKLKNNRGINDNCRRIQSGGIDYSSMSGIVIYVSAGLYSSSQSGILINARRYELPLTVTIACRSRDMTTLHKKIHDVYSAIEETIWKENRLDGTTNGLRSFIVNPYELTDEDGNPEMYRIDIDLVYDFIMAT